MQALGLQEREPWQSVMDTKGPVPYGADGYEKNCAGNCLGHFLLVDLRVMFLFLQCR
jgi:hypothetical protein